MNISKKRIVYIKNIEHFVKLLMSGTSVYINDVKHTFEEGTFYFYDNNRKFPFNPMVLSMDVFKETYVLDEEPFIDLVKKQSVLCLITYTNGYKTYQIISGYRYGTWDKHLINDRGQSIDIETIENIEVVSNDRLEGLKVYE